MRFNTNRWNRVRYTLYTPFYNIIDKIFARYRRKAINKLGIEKGAKVLILGAGTGLDLDFLRKEIEITAIDITPAMLEKLISRAEKLKLNVDCFVMDGQKLVFESGYFDYIILHLILAVIPDPYKTISEAVRVLKDGGKISILDKFLQKGKSPGVLRTFFNLFSKILFTDLNRRYEDIIQGTPLKVISEEDALANGLFKIIIVQKK